MTKICPGYSSKLCSSYGNVNGPCHYAFAQHKNPGNFPLLPVQSNARSLDTDIAIYKNNEKNVTLPPNIENQAYSSAE